MAAKPSNLIVQRCCRHAAPSRAQSIAAGSDPAIAHPVWLVGLATVLHAAFFGHAIEEDAQAIMVVPLSHSPPCNAQISFVCLVARTQPGLVLGTP